MLSSCTGKTLDYYQDTAPVADLREYFNGSIKGWGMVQDWRGRVVTRFDMDMEGSWEGNVGTLDETFRYYNGKTQTRVWTLEKVGEGRYEGRADDIIGKAEIDSRGSAVRLKYAMDLPVDDKVYRIHFQDWMWVMNDGVLINRAYLKKFGITVSELTVFMQKQKP